MTKYCKNCHKKLSFLEGKMHSLNGNKKLLCQECIQKIEYEKKCMDEKRKKEELEQKRKEAERYKEMQKTTKDKMDKVFSKHSALYKEKIKIKEQQYKDYYGIGEKEAMKIWKELQHLLVDIKMDNKDAYEFANLAFSNYSKNEVYKIYVYGIMLLSEFRKVS
jgi:hypothetical protein